MLRCGKNKRETGVVGKTRCIDFPTGVTPVCIPFDGPHGPVAIQVGLDACRPRTTEAELASVN